MPASWPAIFSAAAAIASAATAIAVFLIHRQNARDAVRPELVLEEFGELDRVDSPYWSWSIAIRRVRNIGKGPAFNLCATAREQRAAAEGFLATMGLRTYEEQLLLEHGAVAEVNWVVFNQIARSSADLGARRHGGDPVR